MLPQELKVLIVDDDKSVRDFLLRFLKMQNFTAQAVEDGAQAIELGKKEKFDLVFMDIRLPKINGLQVFSEMRISNPNLSCIFMTGYAIEATLLDSLSRSPTTVCLRKPFENIVAIKDIIKDVLANTTEEKTVSVKDRRAFVRLDIVLEVDYKLKQSQGAFVHSSSKDVSPGGIKLLIQEKLDVGSVLDVVLRIPASQTMCKAVGEVVWIDLSQNKAGYYETGIRITEVDFSEFSRFLLESGQIK